MAVTVATTNAQPAQGELDLFLRSAYECMHGRPRLFIETYLWIETPQGIVRALFNPTWEYYYRETFGGLKRYDEAMERELIKARKAMWTTYIKCCEFSFLWCVSSFHALSGADKKDNAALFLKMLNTNYYNLPEWMREQDARLLRWEETNREILFTLPGGQRATSSIRIGSPHTGGFGQGPTPKMIEFDEAGSYAPDYEQKLYTDILNSPPKGAWVLLAGTPQGSKTYFYRNFKAMQEKDSPGQLLVRYWYENVENQYPPGDPEALPEDRGDIVIGDVTRPGGDTEEAVAPRFPKDGIPPESRIRRRRRLIQRAVTVKDGNVQLGFLDFQQEWLEDMTLCWLGGSVTQVSLDAQTAMARRAVAPWKEYDVPGVPGLHVRLACHPAPGASYGGVLDPSEGRTGGDPTAFAIFDRDTGMNVAEMYGHAAPDVAVRHAIELCRMFNDAVFVPLITGNYGSLVTFTHQEGYYNIYRRPLRDREDMNSDSFRTRPRGFIESGEQENMRAAFLNYVNKGTLWTPFAQAQSDWFGYDWASGEHKPDRTVCAAVFAVIRYHLPMGRIKGAGPGEPAMPRYPREMVTAGGQYASYVSGSDGALYS